MKYLCHHLSGLKVAVCVIAMAFLPSSSSAGDNKQPLFYDGFSRNRVGDYTNPPVFDIYEQVPDPAQWRVRDGRLVGNSDFAPWSYLLRGKKWRNIRISTRFVVARAQKPGRSYAPEVITRLKGRSQARNYFGELAPGYEAALVARRRGTEQFYRLQFSTRWQELALWEPEAGYLAVVPYKIVPGKAYKVEWELQGNVLRVTINGKRILELTDRLQPYGAGAAGVGVYDAKVHFDDLRIERLADVSSPEPAHTPEFREVTWHNSRWILDGNEPVAEINRRRLISLDHAKIRPGAWPVFWTWLHWDAYYKRADELVALDVKVPAKNRLEIDVVTHEDAVDFTSQRHIVLTYDATRDTYVWDFDCVVKFGPSFDEKQPPAHLQFTDPYLSNACAPPRAVKRPWEPAWKWTLVTAPDGTLYRNPLHHNQAALAGGSAEIKAMHPKGMSAMVGNSLVNPAWKMIKTVKGLDLHQASCGWSYDHHLYYTFPDGAELDAGDRFRTRFRLMNYSEEKAERLLERASLHPKYDPDNPGARRELVRKGMTTGAPDWRHLLSTMDRNSFDQFSRIDRPHAEYLIRGDYTADRQTGRTDNHSLRLNPGGHARLNMGGPSYYGDAFKAEKYRFTAWIKTENVSGDGPVIAIANRHKGDANRTERFKPEIRGSRDWTHVSFVTGIPTGDAGLFCRLKHMGEGRVWFDDLDLRPVE